MNMILHTKIKYLINSTQKFIFNKGFSCPSCGHKNSTVTDRKYLVTTLRRCKNCKLLFRSPTTTDEENRKFYQNEYNQGFTTDTPALDALQSMTDRGFKGTEKDYSDYMDVLRALGCKKGEKLLDFGCSWGYGSWQLMKAGFSVKSFEISVPRANFAREHLNVEVHSDISDIEGLFDIFFSSHVLEHVPSVKKIIELAYSLLKPNGLFVAFTPNGSACYRLKNYTGWHKIWGFVHPNMLDEVYYKTALCRNFRAIVASNPYPSDELKKWESSSESDFEIKELHGNELLVAARKTV